jgi:hypothetical protein
MTEYQIEYDDDGNPEPCSCCEYENIPVSYYDFQEKGFLCEICAATYISQINGTQHLLAKSIAWIGNHIIQKMEQNAKSSS